MTDEAPPVWYSLVSNIWETALWSAAMLVCCLRAFARRLGELDSAATYWVSTVAGEFEWWIAAAPSRLGDGWIYAAVVLGLRNFGYRTQAGHIAGCVLTAWGYCSLLKMLIRRRRVNLNPGVLPRKFTRRFLSDLKSWSFPSQHAACAAAFTASLYDHQTAFAIAAALALAICFSRIAIGAHYLGDVLAGIAVGVAAGVWG